jgi:heme exporter protein B
MNILQVTSLKKSYGLKLILRGIDLSLERGERIALTGANGTGKTTLLRTLAGLTAPSAGSICIEGLDIQQYPQQARGLIGFVGHQPYLYDELTALENLLFFGHMYGIQQARQRAHELLHKVGLEKHTHERLGSLSRGQVQRLALARALLHSPSLLLLDEPDTGLDEQGNQLLETLIQEHIQQNGSVLFSTHQREHAQSLADHIITLEHGRISTTDNVTAPSPGDSVLLADTKGRVATTQTQNVVGDEDPFAGTRGVVTSLSQVLTILWKDIRCELRSKQTWTGMALFALLVLVIFNFAFDLRADNKAAVAPGALWVSFVFASLLGLGRTIAAEREKGSFDRLMLCPVDSKAIYLAKLLGNLLFIGVVELVALPIYAALFDVPLFASALIPIVLLGTLGIATVGTLFSAMAATTRAQELLLPILVFPLIVPVVIGAVRATGSLLAPVANDPPWLGLIIAFDIIFLSISTLTFGYVIEE